jgi:regulator of CtrA degradation
MTEERDEKTTNPVVVPLHFDGTYDEAFDLLVEARDYVERSIPALKYSSQPPNPATVTMETLRLTSRITQVMAWVMAQRAVHEGEIEADELSQDRYRVEGKKTCLKRVIDDMDDLPGEFRQLMDRSYNLYSRILRLDEQIADPEKKN